MSSSPIVLCNRALSTIGAREYINDLQEGSPAARACQLWYDTTRTSLLRAAPWAFARRQVPLSLIGTLAEGTSPYPFLYKYIYPGDCIKLRYILPPPVLPGTYVPPQVGVGPVGPWAGGPSRTNRFLVAADVNSGGEQTKVVISNVQYANAVYTMDVTDTTMFDALFDSALVAALAALLVVPLSGDRSLINTLNSSAESAIRQARAADGNESITQFNSVPDWIEARGSGFLGPYGIPGGPEWGNWYAYSDNWSM